MPNQSELDIPVRGPELTKIFLSDELQRLLKQDAPAALRELAAAIERGEIKLFSPELRGNGFLASRWNRVVMDVHFSLEVPCFTRANSE